MGPPKLLGTRTFIYFVRLVLILIIKVVHFLESFIPVFLFLLVVLIVVVMIVVVVAVVVVRL